MRRQKVKRNYWDLEEPVITEVDNAELRFFSKAGKLQLYSVFEDKETGEPRLSKACVWDVNTFSNEDILRVVYGIMDAFLETGISNIAFDKAFDIIKKAVDELPDEEEAETDVESLVKQLELAELKTVTKELGEKVTKKDTAETLIEKILQYEDDDILETLNSLGLMDNEEEEEDDAEVDNEENVEETVAVSEAVVNGEILDEEFEDEAISQEKMDGLLRTLSLVQTKRLATDFDISYDEKKTRKFELVEQLINICDLDALYARLVELNYIDGYLLGDSNKIVKNNINNDLSKEEKNEKYADWVTTLDNETLLAFYKFVMHEEYSSTGGRFNRIGVISAMTKSNKPSDLYDASKRFEMEQSSDIKNNEDNNEPGIDIKNNSVSIDAKILPMRKRKELDLSCTYKGKHIIYSDGKYRNNDAIGLKLGKLYLDCCDIASGGINYIIEQHNIIKAMPTKTAKQKKEQNEVYAELNSTVDEWVASWEDDGISTEVGAIANKTVLGSYDYNQAMLEFVKLIDNIKMVEK